MRLPRLQNTSGVSEATVASSIEGDVGIEGGGVWIIEDDEEARGGEPPRLLAPAVVDGFMMSPAWNGNGHVSHKICYTEFVFFPNKAFSDIIHIHASSTSSFRTAAAAAATENSTHD